MKSLFSDRSGVSRSRLLELMVPRTHYLYAEQAAPGDARDESARLSGGQEPPPAPPPGPDEEDPDGPLPMQDPPAPIPVPPPHEPPPLHVTHCRNGDAVSTAS